MDRKFTPQQRTHLAENDLNSEPIRIGGRVQDILVSFGITAIPMLTFSVLLLGLIYHYRVVQNDFVSPNLAFGTHENQERVVYTSLSATTLIIIASWSSSIAPILVGFIINLTSYPIAGRLLAATEANAVNELPTPFQFSLILRMVVNGSPAALWRWLKYHFRSRRDTQGPSLRIMVTALVLGLALRYVDFALASAPMQRIDTRKVYL
jgi:hypothetical protein